MIIERELLKTLRASRKSALLLGPRQTGKSTLMAALKPDVTINLAHEPTYLAFLAEPKLLEETLPEKKSLVFIDEIQRIPSLLNTIQYLIDTGRGRCRFLLTGSSARKLKRGQANLLPGRVHVFRLGALAARELDYRLDLKKALSIGMLPGIYLETDSAESKRTLRSYAATYLREEVQVEALTRNLEGFSRFFMVAAASCGDFLDFTKFGSAAQVNRVAAMRFFDILEDTLLASRVPAFAKSERTRLIQHPRYFFFDVGVMNGALGNFTVSQDRLGRLFENFIFNQMEHGAAALDEEVRISTYRTEHGAEVDFIVEFRDKIFAVEVKASANVAKSDLKGFKSFAGYYGKPHRQLVLYTGHLDRRIGGVEVLPWSKGLARMGF